MDALYYSDECCSLPNLKDEQSLSDAIGDDALNDFVKRVYKGAYKKGGFDPKRVSAYAKVFSKAVTKGFADGGGNTQPDFDTPDANMLAALRTNIFQFSAAKNRAEIIQMNAKLRDPKGKLRTFKDFAHEAQKIGSDFQGRYLKVEYDNAVNSSYLAARWNEFEEDDILVFRTAGDERVRTSHKALDGTSLPKSHPFWKTFYPPLAWNCRCTVEVTHSGRATSEEQIPWGEIDSVPPIFRSNFAAEGMAFPPRHPYFILGHKDNKGNIRSVGDVRMDTLKVHKNGGRVVASKMVDRNADDFQKVFDCCQHFASDGELAEILPKVHKDSPEYEYFFKGLKGTIYEGKCPDFRVGSDYYEHEGYETTKLRNTLKNMFTRGLRQSSKIIIEDEGSALNHIKKVINIRKKDGQTIEEVWILMPDKSLVRAY